MKNLPRSVLYADNQSSEFEPMSKFYLEPVLRNMAGKHYRVVLEYARWQSARNPDVYNAEPIYPDEMLDAIGRDRGYEDAGLDMAV